MLYWGEAEDKLSTSIKLGNRFFDFFFFFENSIDLWMLEIVPGLNCSSPCYLMSNDDAGLLQLYQVYNLALFGPQSVCFGFYSTAKKIAVGLHFSTAYYYEILIRQIILVELFTFCCILIPFLVLNKLDFTDLNGAFSFNLWFWVLHTINNNARDEKINRFD